MGFSPCCLTVSCGIYRRSVLLFGEKAKDICHKYVIYKQNRYVDMIYLAVCSPYPINRTLSPTQKGIITIRHEDLKSKHKHMVSHQKRHSPNDESSKKPPFKEAVCTIWNLTETLLILLSYMHVHKLLCIYVPWLYFYEGHSSYF